MTTLLAHYQRTCDKAHLHEDAVQLALVHTLQKLTVDLKRSFAPKSLWARFHKPKAPNGLYIYGGVGRGKSLLMDLFYDDLSGISKRRYHFHQFMQHLHEELKKEMDRVDDKSQHHPMDHIAQRLSHEAKVICFDEFHFKDITDGMLLQQLIRYLWKHNVVIVATSNHPPLDLYQDGYQRSLILPFLHEMTEQFDLYHLEGAVDYRRQFLQKQQRYFLTRPSDGFHKPLHTLFSHLREDTPSMPLTLTHKKREWVIPCVASGIALVPFQDLCGEPHSAEDYLALSKHIHTLLLENIPALDDESLDQVKRFITLIDVLYDQGINFAASGTMPLSQIYNGTKEHDLFQRTLSRLVEMTGAS